MRTALIILLWANIASAAELGPILQDGATCRAGFVHYYEWCVATSTNFDYTYDQAVNFCIQKGANAPSIHSQYDLNFWSQSLNVIADGSHFWTDAYCPSNGQTYRWRDGTSTDFLGPRGELQSCQEGNGFHIHKDGFEYYDFTVGAPAVCVYPAAAPPPLFSTSEPYSTTVAPASTPEEPASTPADPVESYCTCEPYSIYLDIVFIVDTSNDMTQKTTSDATATIQSILYSLTFGTNIFQSNVAVLAYADTVKVVSNFGTFKKQSDIPSLNIPYLGGKSTKMTDAILQASSMISINARSYTRGVIVLLSKSFNQLDATNINEAAESFRNDGGIFIAIDYATGQGIKGLPDIASPGYYLKNSVNTLLTDAIYALCDANCFCPDGLLPYNVADERGRELPKGCYHIADVAAVYEAADQNCQRQSGFVATVHDNEKNFFMLSLFPQKARYWLGLRVTSNTLEWADGSSDGFTSWAPSNPVNGQNCVYAQQTTGFNTKWYSAPCTDPLKNSMTYACQLRPCDSEYYCWT